MDHFWDWVLGVALGFLIVFPAITVIMIATRPRRPSGKGKHVRRRRSAPPPAP